MFLPNGLSINNLKRIENLYKNFQYSIVSKNQININNVFKIINEEYNIQCVTENLENSHILDYPPIYYSNKFYYVIPIINIMEKAQQKIRRH